MDPRNLTRVLIPGLTLLLAGCGINALTIKSATQVNIASQTVVTQAKAAIDDASARRERAYTTLIASDPSCPLSDPVNVLIPSGPPLRGEALPPLCWYPAKPGDKPPVGYRVEAISFAPISNEALKPTLSLIGAVADYGDLLGKIAGEPKPDVAKELEGLKSKVADIKTIAEGLAGIKIPEIAALGTKQVDTATKLATFIAGLAAEAQNVEKIREAVRKHEDKLPEVIEELRVQIGSWQKIVAKGYAQISSNNIGRAYSDAERRHMSFADRTAMVTLFRQSQRDEATVPVTVAAFNGALDKFKDANVALRALLDKKPTPAQRAEADQITRDRVLEGLKLISEAVTAWGGII